MEIVKGFKERDYVPKGGLSTTIDYLLDRDLMNFWVMSSSVSQYYKLIGFRI